jgi:hypothetical protein
MKINRRSLVAGALGLLGAKKAKPAVVGTRVLQPVLREMNGSVGAWFTNVSYTKPTGAKGSIVFHGGLVTEIR